MSVSVSALMNFWLSVSLSSRLRGPMSVNWTISPALSAALASSGTRNRLLSRVKVTAVSCRAQRGFDSSAVVRVMFRRVLATESTIAMSPSSANSTRRWAASQTPLGGGAVRRSASDSFRGSPPSRATTHVDASSSSGRRHSKYRRVESPDQRKPVGG